MPLSAFELDDIRQLVTDPEMGFLSDTAIIYPDVGVSDGRGGTSTNTNTSQTVPCRLEGSMSPRGLQIIALRPSNKVHAEISLPWNIVVKNDMHLTILLNDFNPPISNEYVIINIIGNTEEPLVHVIVEQIQ